MRSLLEGIRGCVALLSVFFVGVLPTVIAVTVFLCFFHELDWLYPLVSIGVWFLSQFVAFKVTKEGWGMGVVLEGVSGGMGWIWMLSIPATLWFLISGIFLEGSWSHLIYSFVVGAFAKGSLRSFNNSLSEWHIKHKPEDRKDKGG